MIAQGNHSNLCIVDFHTTIINWIPKDNLMNAAKTILRWGKNSSISKIIRQINTFHILSK